MADYSFVTHRGTLVTPNWKIWDDAYGLHAIKTMELVQNSLGSTLGPSAGIPFILITAQHSKAKKKKKENQPDHFKMSIQIFYWSSFIISI